MLKDVSFTLRPGASMALVGHTGAGKTTIISLLLRFYDPERGRITLDGVDLRDLSLSDLRGAIGFVQQDLFLFAGDILRNLTLDAGIPDQRAKEAAQRVGADRFIARLPEGYGHLLGERGKGLSVGERQLLSFARALALDPAILVLDEATSSVDADAEAQIQRAVAELMRGRTSLVVAHRLSTILHADEILVLHHGEIRERGTHRELLASGGLYRTTLPPPIRDLGGVRRLSGFACAAPKRRIRLNFRLFRPGNDQMLELEFGGRRYAVPQGESAVGADPSCLVALSGAGHPAKACDPAGRSRWRPGRPGGGSRRRSLPSTACGWAGIRHRCFMATSCRWPASNCSAWTPTGAAARSS